jgi:DNA-binding NtrC family response regulator
VSHAGGRFVSVREKRFESEPEDEEPTRGSGVRERAPTLRILLLEPDAVARAALESAARADAVRFIVAGTTEEADAVRAREPVDVVACSFPMRDAVRFVSALRRERFPVVLMTTEITRAVEAFGLQLPVLKKPVELSQLLRQAIDIMRPDGDPNADSSLAGAVTEIAPPPNPGDPRRE